MSAPFNPTQDLYVDDAAKAKVSWAGRIGVGLTGATLVAAVAIVICKGEWSQPLVLGMAGLWGIGAPMWFFWEYFFIYRKHGAPDSWELFKHGQQLSATVWVALTASLTLLGTSDLVKQREATYRCVPDPSAHVAPPKPSASPATSVQTVLICSSAK